MYSVQHIRESHEHVNLRGVDGNIDGEMTKKKMVKQSMDHKERCRIGKVYRCWNGTKKRNK